MLNTNLRRANDPRSSKSFDKTEVRNEIAHATARVIAVRRWMSGTVFNAVTSVLVMSKNSNGMCADPERNRMNLNRVPQGRCAESENSAGAGTFFVPPATRCVSGITTHVDGGWSDR